MFVQPTGRSVNVLLPFTHAFAGIVAWSMGRGRVAVI